MRATLLSAALPFASSSRASVSTPVRVLAARSVVTIPHPDLTKGGERHVIIKTFDRLPTTAHALAVVKAVEARLGPVMSFEVPRDVDTQQPRNIAFVELLRPVEAFDRPLVLEIPAPHVSKEIGTGGVGYDDVAAALRRTSNPSDNVDEADGDELARTTSKTIQFRIELPRTPTRRAPRAFNVRPSTAERREDDEIVRALQAFGTGFYGGFDGVSDQFAHLVKEKPPAATTEPAELQAEAEAEAEEAHLRQSAPRTPRPAAQESTPAPEAAPAPVAPEPRRRSRAERLREAALEAARVNARLEAEARESATDDQPQQQHEQPEQEPRSAPADAPAGEDKKGMWGWFGGKK